MFLTSTTGALIEDLVVQESNGVNSNMVDAADPKHNTTYCGAIERSEHAQCLWAAAHYRDETFPFFSGFPIFSWPISSFL